MKQQITQMSKEAELIFNKISADVDYRIYNVYVHKNKYGEITKLVLARKIMGEDK